MTRFRAILLPGGILPAEFAYPDLVRALGPEIDARYKELELYAGQEPPPGWGLDTEVEGIHRFADQSEFDRFHLVGYSAGGAFSRLLRRTSRTTAQPDTQRTWVRR